MRVLPGTRTRNQLDVALARHRKRVKLTPDQWKAMVDYLAADTPHTTESLAPTAPASPTPAGDPAPPR